MINKQKNVEIEGAEGILMGCDIIYDRESMPQPVIIYAHGFNGFKDWGNMDGMADRFAQAGFAFVKFNVGSPGTELEFAL